MKVNELYHYGVKGMRWGVRHDKKYLNTHNTMTETEEGKRVKKHLGLDDKGNINFISEKTSAKAKRNFAIKMSLMIGPMVLATFLKKHPYVVDNGRKVVNDFLKKYEEIPIEHMSVDSGIYSKSLERMLTIQEATDLGLDL